MLGNYSSVSIEAEMSELVRIGEYELLEKQNEGYMSN